MAVTKKILSQYDVKLVTKWTPPEDDDLRPLIAMPNIPKPCHLLNPRNLLGASTWNHMRKRAYAMANDTCEICGAKPENLRHRHGHEVYSIDYEKGTVTFQRVFCICALCHLGCIHTGRAITLFKQGNPLYPKEFLLEGAEKAFTIISSYNRDHPEADLRAYRTFLDYLKCDELREPMEALIKKYNIKFYMEDPEKTADWKDWELIIGKNHYPTPYEDEKAWKEAMKKQGEKDTDRILQKRMDEIFSGELYDELNKILQGGTNESTTSNDRGSVDSL